jgi:hypothetical protein
VEVLLLLLLDKTGLDDLVDEDEDDLIGEDDDLIAEDEDLIGEDETDLVDEEGVEDVVVVRVPE